ncbi:GNAT family N-acetyltransferase [Streptomyces sp. NPDC053048]|uniref:GNAT family N-acetyltransferase n=1 Tax=Streptomyces sp. NPDC053048 TaxID=3365694 RepID=UPI0037D9313F
MVIYRPALPGELAAVDELDNSFTTGTVLQVTASDDGFTLRTVPVDPPLRKVFPDDEDEDGDGAEVLVALDDGELCGAITSVYEEWNRRLVIADVRVAPTRRGQGIGGGLMDRALARGRERGARTAWLEVSSVNAPAVRAYRRMGFALCGLDTTLYTGTASEGETALFMSRPLGGGPATAGPI